MNEDKSARYHRLKRRASVATVVAAAAVPALLLLSGGSVALRDATGGLLPSGRSPQTAILLYGLIFVLLQEVVSLPLDFYSSFRLERRYGLSSESLGAWLRDRAKAFALLACIAIAAAEIVYLTMRLAGEWWWLLSAGAFTAMAVAMARLLPVLMPLFYRFSPIERPALRERLATLSARARVPVMGIFEWSLGDRTSRANAALVGTGRTRRILVSDTLLAEYTDDEIEVILAHELAHHVHHDIVKGLVVESLLLLVGFYAAARALSAWWEPLGLAGPQDVAGAPLLLLAGGAVTLAATPLLYAISRANERRADRFALRLTRQPEAFVSAMRRLAAQNLAEERPSRLALWLFHSHPPFADRIGAAGQFRGGVDQHA